MSKPHEIVKTGMPLAAFFRRYPDDAAAEKQWEAWRWPSGPQCPRCESHNVASVRERRPMPYRCRDCRRHFSVMSHTVMHASKLGAQTWLLGLFLILSNSKGKSSVQLAADLGISQKSAWHVGHRLRKALADGSLPGFEGPVECDETFIGGKAKNMHAKVRRRRIHGRGAVDKAPVVGVKDRASGRVAAPTDGRHHQRHADRHRLRHDPARLDGVHRRRPRLRPAQGDGLPARQGHALRPASTSAARCPPTGSRTTGAS